MNNLLLNNPAKGPGATIYFCKVTRFYASSNTADVVTIDNNISLPGCNIVCSMPAGFAYGTRYIPTHDDQNSEVEYVNSAGDIYCVAAFLENDYNNAAILGFIFPLETTLSISEYGLYIFRHESDVMWMVRGDGTMQIYHPSGSVIKIGDTITNEMTDQIDTAGLYPAKTAGFYVRPADDYNTNKESNLFITWYKGQKVKIDSDGNVIVSTEDTSGAVVTTITMTPTGFVQVNATQDVTVTAGRDVIANANRDVTVHADRNVVAYAEQNVTVTANTGNIIAQAQQGDATVNAKNATVNAATLATLSSDTDIKIQALRDISMTAVSGKIEVLAPTSTVLVGGVGAAGTIPTSQRKYSFN